MQGSNFGREVEDPGQERPPPRSAPIESAAQAEAPLSNVLWHLQASLNDVQAVQERMARQQGELAAMRAEVLTISEKERGRIGRDLHDVLGQILTAIAFVGKTLERSLGSYGVAEAEDARQICDLASEGMRQTRILARGLCSADVRADELVARLESLALDTQRTFHIGCDFELRGEPGPAWDDAMATNLYCIALESITNAVKHGRARTARLRLTVRDSSIMLVIQDDGVGFRGAERFEGIGLRLMSHRAGLMGGSLRIESQPGAGTTVICDIPSRRPEQRAASKGQGTGDRR